MRASRNPWLDAVSVAPGGFQPKSKTNGALIRDVKWRVRVQIEKAWYSGLRAYLADVAVHRSAASLAAEIQNLPFEPYAPIRQQLLNIVRHVNQRRQAAGLETIGYDVIRYRRRIVKPFERLTAADNHILMLADESERGFFSPEGLIRATRSLY